MRQDPLRRNEESASLSPRYGEYTGRGADVTNLNCEGPPQPSATGSRAAWPFHRSKTEVTQDVRSWFPLFHAASGRDRSRTLRERHIPISAYLPLFPVPTALPYATWGSLSGRAQARCSSQARMMDS